jgi:hypothetical protein
VINLEAKERVQIYLDTISKYLVPEIKGLASKRPDDKGYEGYTIPLALTLFALIDVLGFLLREKDAKGKKPKPEETGKNFDALLAGSKYFPGIYSEKKTWSVLLKVFRHGISHTLFPKVSGIGKHGEEQLIAEDLNGCKFDLNVDRLTKDCLEAFKKIKLMVEEGADEELINRIDERITQLYDEDLKKIEEIEKKSIQT